MTKHTIARVARGSDLFLSETQRFAADAAARWAIGYHPLKRVLNLQPSV